MDKFPKGLTVQEERDWVRREQIRSSMDQVVAWLKSLRPHWQTNATLTFANEKAAEEQAEKAVRWWLRNISSGCWAICGLEQQMRGSWHAHLVIDRYIDFRRGNQLWKSNGFAWLKVIRQEDGAIAYTIKHAIKRGEISVFGPGGRREYYSTTWEAKLSGKSPTQYEMEALAELSGKRPGQWSTGQGASRNADAEGNIDRGGTLEEIKRPST